MNALIFGANGQDGFYLNQLCGEKKIGVIGVSRSHSNWAQGSVSDFNYVENLIKKEQPEYIFHLAANSSTKHDALFENHETISTGTLNILESVKRHCPESRVFLTGSGVQFKNKGLPIKETDEFDANSPYSVGMCCTILSDAWIKGVCGLFIPSRKPASETHPCEPDDRPNSKADCGRK